MRERQKNKELKVIALIVAIYFAVFLLIPIVSLLMKSFISDVGVGIENYKNVLGERNFFKALGNSFAVSAVSGIVTTVLAFFLAYTIEYTNLWKGYKSVLEKVARLPMLLPTITYGFAIIYSFGKQGLLTRLFGRQIFDIYGFQGLMLGYVVYTLPVAFLIIRNTMQYVDKSYMVVSRVMGDSPLQTFLVTVLRPLGSTLISSFVQVFFLCFTDFGIPAAVGGEYETIAGVLYQEMLGSIPDFGRGAVVALVMLCPSIISIVVLKILEKHNIRYNKVSEIECKKSVMRDGICFLGSVMISVSVLSIFAVIFIIPFVEDWPYYTTFTLEHVKTVFQDNVLLQVLKNSVLVSLLTALLGTLIAYGCALITARSNVSQKIKSLIEGIAMVTNTIPGMVLGLAFLFVFSGTPIQGTLTILVVCNVVHYFSTPYLMMKNSLSKMNASWETTGMLMGDRWINTIIRVVTPNAISTILEVFSYYFINAMVTISAVIFIAGAHSMVITTKIKELQYYNKFNEIFVLSLLILFINIVSKAVFQYLANRNQKDKKTEEKRKMKKRVKAGIAMCLAATLAIGAFGGCGSKSDKVVIYSNADDEAIECMKQALDENGYKDQYMFQTFGTSELGGKLLAEKNDIEADMVTMSTFYVESAQEQSQMFQKLSFDVNTVDEFPDYCAPITAQEGTIIINTEEMKNNNLPMPTSIKDLADPVYKGMISVTDISSSSTAWLLIQGLISEYGEEETKNILTKIYKNAGPHIEESGSGPLKKVRAGEVAIGFGLRQQAVADKAEGLPIDYIDPVEGNFTLTESVAVVDKGDKTNEKAMKMAQCIIENGRAGLQKYYPVALYEGETTDSASVSGNPKTFPEKLTVDLLKQHQELSESCKPQ